MRAGVVALALALATGCATTPPLTRRPPAPQAPPATRPAPGRPPSPAPAPPVALPPEAPPAGPTATLMADAARLRTQGRLEGAASALERALRIDPANPALWQRLAEVRLDQGRPRDAEQLALKSTQLAREDSVLRARGWILVAEARRRAGDTAGAAEAEARAR